MDEEAGDGKGLFFAGVSAAGASRLARLELPVTPAAEREPLASRTKDRPKLSVKPTGEPEAFGRRMGDSGARPELSVTPTALVARRLGEAAGRLELSVIPTALDSLAIRMGDNGARPDLSVTPAEELEAFGRRTGDVGARAAHGSDMSAEANVSVAGLSGFAMSSAAACQAQQRVSLVQSWAAGREGGEGGDRSKL